MFGTIFQKNICTLIL